MPLRQVLTVLYSTFVDGSKIMTLLKRSQAERSPGTHSEFPVWQHWIRSFLALRQLCHEMGCVCDIMNYMYTHNVYAYAYVYVCMYASFLCFGWVLHPPIVDPNTPPYQCFRGCCTPIRVTACKADLYSIVITKRLYTCKYTATDCAIVTLAEDRGWIQD